MSITEAIRILKLHKQIDDAWYPMAVVKWEWSKGRMKYRDEVYNAVEKVISYIEKKRTIKKGRRDESKD